MMTLTIRGWDTSKLIIMLKGAGQGHFSIKFEPFFGLELDHISGVGERGRGELFIQMSPLTGYYMCVPLCIRIYSTYIAENTDIL